MKIFNSIQNLSPELEERIKKNPLLNLDTFIIPSPYVRDSSLQKDYDHSFVWVEEGEILGYLLVYSDHEKKRFHIYKLVSSPFGRGRGIGQAFIMHLASRVPGNALIYLYLWEKQSDTLEFFQSRGFSIGDPLVYRNLIYYLIYSTGSEILGKHRPENSGASSFTNEIGKTRHDARKLVRLLSHMVESLSAENCDRIVEDINRETTTLINMLNIFRDSRKIIHEVNLKNLILERIVPYVQASSTDCSIQLKLSTKTPVVLGYHENIGRALVNLVSNSLEAIEARGCSGTIKISVYDENGEIVLKLRDNGTGIPPDLMEKDDEGTPLFVGKTTKNRRAGEGLGTLQIYSTFGAENIRVDSLYGRGTTWKIRMKPSNRELNRYHVQLERRFNEFRDLWEDYNLGPDTERTAVTAFIWQLRQMEIFLFDLILQFSSSHNIRTIYRNIFSYTMGNLSSENLEDFIKSLKCEHEQIKNWLYEISVEIRRRLEHFSERITNKDSFRGAMFRSYGQVRENVIIFTLDPETGRFFASDRKLAEHLDFAPYLAKPRDALLRGEFSGDLNNHSKPIFIGVWSIDSDEDLLEKLKLIRKGAAKLIEIGIHADKRLAFYQTTYINHTRDIDSYAATTFGKFANTPDAGLMDFTREADTDDYGFLAQLD